PNSPTSIAEEIVQATFATTISFPVEERSAGYDSQYDGTGQHNSNPIKGPNDYIGSLKGLLYGCWIRRTKFERNIAWLPPFPIDPGSIFDLADNIFCCCYVLNVDCFDYIVAGSSKYPFLFFLLRQ